MYHTLLGKKSIQGKPTQIKFITLPVYSLENIDMLFSKSLLLSTIYNHYM